MKRSLSLFLCLCLLLALFPTALAESAEETLPETTVPVEETAPELAEPDAEAAPPADEPELSAEEAPGEPAADALRQVRFVCEPADLQLALYDPAELDDTGVRFLFRPEADASYLLKDGNYAFDAVREGYEPILARAFTLEGEPLEIPVTLHALSGAAEPEAPEDEYAALAEAWPNDALFTEYVDRLFYPSVQLRAAKPELNLGAADYYVEQQLKAAVLEIAAGKRSSTEFLVPLGEYVYSDLTPSSIFHTLFKDAGAELYWFAGRYSWGARDGNCFGCTLLVASDYQDGDDRHVSGVKVRAAQRAVENVGAIIARFRDYDDIEKLRGYKDVVCELVDYDYAAATAGSAVAGNDPWELVNVFDGDPETRVVCEGYAKAFQYLCDKSVFNGKVNCICTSGTVYWNNVSGGSHMWNLVMLDDGRNYLIDPTGCDDDPVSDKRFLLYALSGSYDSTDGFIVSSGDRYSFYHNIQTAAGVPGYSSDVLDAFPASMLRLSTLPYGESEEEIPLEAEVFPDPVFRSLVQSFDADLSGGLSVMERAGVTALELNGLGLHALDGIEVFPALETLHCAGNSLTALTLSGNRLLKDLDCSRNAISALPLEENMLLTTLDCSGNALKSLDLSENSYLTALRCADMPLASLKMAKLTALTVLDCGGTALLSLDISRCAALVRAVLEGAFDSAEGNQSYRIDADSVLLCCPASADIDTGFISITAENFPDAAFRTCVAGFDTDGDGLLSRDERTAVRRIDCSASGVADLTGLRLFPSVSYLNCAENAITALDTSTLSNLLTLYCYQNLLTELDLRQNRSLQVLNCSNNALGELDLRPNTKITWLNCHDASLTSLNLRGLTNLKSFYCYSNRLTELDLSTNIALNACYTYRNSLTSLDLSRSSELSDLQCYRNKLTTLTLGSKNALAKLYCESNSLESLDLGGCPQLLEACALGSMRLTSSYRQINSSPVVLRFDPDLPLMSGSDTVWSTAPNFFPAAEAKSLLNDARAPQTGDAAKSLFSGWYRDAACMVPVTAASELGSCGAFAKFVSGDVLNVAVQIRQKSLSEKEGASDIRFVSSAPAAGSYDRIGFVLTMPSHDDFLVSDHAFLAPLYDRIYAGGKPYDLAGLHSLGLFPDGSDSEKIAVQTVTGFPARFFSDGSGCVFRVRAYLITHDGTTVYGQEKCFTLTTEPGGLRTAVITDSLGNAL